MKREIRASTVAGMAGVGAIVDVGQESFLIQGIELWRQNQLRVVNLRRLSARLRKVLKAPSEERPSLMIKRFPRAMFCEDCRKMVMWKTAMEQENLEPSCPDNNCKGTLVPMRFVVACENGHLDDVNWWRWAHSGPNMVPGCRSYDSLSFTVDQNADTAGLASIMVKCKCGSCRNLEDLPNKAAVKGLFDKCNGGHPWVAQKEECGADVVVLQRGATNLHYPSTISALDIPGVVVEDQASEYADQVREHPRYTRLVGLLKSTDGDNQEYIEMCAGIIERDVGCDISTVLEVAVAESEGRIVSGSGDDNDIVSIDQDLLLDEEWKTIHAALQVGQMTSHHFSAIAEPLDINSPDWLNSLVSGVLLIRRLREVKAYLGFQRVTPGSTDQTVRPDVGSTQNWLPASEVFGEGVVLALNYQLLDRWANQLPEEEKETIRQLENKRVDENFWFLPEVNPVFLVLHTLSHLLLRRITFECGYSSSSLRERLYFNSENTYAGVMIYTADGDSEGSLGGLVRQGRRDRLAQSVVEALDQGFWCSSDPVCTETAGQGLGGFNHAACHACSLVSETSCTAANTLLNRKMLFDPKWGLLSFLEKNK